MGVCRVLGTAAVALLTLAALLGAAGCGGDDRPSATPTTPTATASTSAPAPSPSADPVPPVPTDIRVTDPGAVDDTWQFDLHTTDPGSVIAFYERVLPRLGYRVRTDLTYTLGNEPVHWDLVFDGHVSGTMAKDPANGVVFVAVNPPGQPAIAGETP